MSWDTDTRKRQMHPPGRTTEAQREGVILELPAELPGLVVRVVATFETPVKHTYIRTYSSSKVFQPTDLTVNGLLRRVEHGCYELVTRRDFDAVVSGEDVGSPKPLRYGLHFRFDNNVTGVHLDRSYLSYQQTPLAMAAAREICLATDRLVGLFLKYHDPGFRWISGSVQEDFTTAPLLEKSNVNGPQSLACIPRSRFFESTQSFEFIPGYTIELAMETRGRLRQPSSWSKILKASSRQTTPLNLQTGEDLLWQVSKALNSALDSRKRAFDDHCRMWDGAELRRGVHCQHFGENALDVRIRVVNNIGPDFRHLERRVRSNLVLFRDSRMQDCNYFVDDLQQEIIQARDETDEAISAMNDFEFKISELSGDGWMLDQPLAVTLGHETAYSRRSIAAILERFHTCMVGELRGNDLKATISAWKRGHLILSKTMIARAGPNKKTFESAEDAKDYFMTRLQGRLEEELEVVCKDTCSLRDSCSESECSDALDVQYAASDLGGENGEDHLEAASEASIIHSDIYNATDVDAAEPADEERSVTDQIPKDLVYEMTVPDIGGAAGICDGAGEVVSKAGQSTGWRKENDGNEDDRISREEEDVSGDPYEPVHGGLDDSIGPAHVEPEMASQETLGSPLDRKQEHQDHKEDLMKRNRESRTTEDDDQVSFGVAHKLSREEIPDMDEEPPNAEDCDGAAVAESEHSSRASEAGGPRPPPPYSESQRSRTPSLVFGDDEGTPSPRNSVFVTPQYIRTASGTVEHFIRVADAEEPLSLTEEAGRESSLDSGVEGEASGSTRLVKSGSRPLSRIIDFSDTGALLRDVESLALEPEGSIPRSRPLTPFMDTLFTFQGPGMVILGQDQHISEEHDDGAAEEDIEGEGGADDDGGVPIDEFSQTKGELFEAERQMFSYASSTSSNNAARVPLFTKVENAEPKLDWREGSRDSTAEFPLFRLDFGGGGTEDIASFNHKDDGLDTDENSGRQEATFASLRPLKAEGPPSRPLSATAGCLGLHEMRLVDVGLRNNLLGIVRAPSRKGFKPMS